MNTYSQPVKYVNKVFRRTDRLGERAKTMKGEKNQSSAFFLTLWVGMQNGPRFKEVICKRNEKCLIWWGAQTKAWNSQWKWLFVKKKIINTHRTTRKSRRIGHICMIKGIESEKAWFDGQPQSSWAFFHVFVCAQTQSLARTTHFASLVSA